MRHFTCLNLHSSFWVHLSYIMLLLSASTYGMEPIDGFRDLKFGMTPQEVQSLTNCSTSHECIYQLSNKNRYLQLNYESENPMQDSVATEILRLSKITIDMGQYTEGSYNQLQMILRKSYRLTHDYSDETMQAFLSKQLTELQIGYEDGQIVLSVFRRQFGNMTLKIIYQNTRLATQFIQQSSTPQKTTP